jgi:hypothetical protein
MSNRLLIHLTPEQHMQRAKAELRHQAMVLRLIAGALEKPDLTLVELSTLISDEMPAVRTGLAVAKNFFATAEEERKRLQPQLMLWQQRIEPSNDGGGERS